MDKDHKLFSHRKSHLKELETASFIQVCQKDSLINFRSVSSNPVWRRRFLESRDDCGKAQLYPPDAFVACYSLLSAVTMWLLVLVVMLFAASLGFHPAGTSDTSPSYSTGMLFSWLRSPHYLVSLFISLRFFIKKPFDSL